MADGIAIKGVSGRFGKQFIAIKQFPRGWGRAKKAFSDQGVPYANPNASIAKQIKN